ncbi:MAG: shikimate kinase [Actinomycetaceae bacterium]|nr:shikimate kinase [Actinomycetaceae bacterium]
MSRVDTVALVGLPGSGKTNLARALGELLGWEVIDLDDYLQMRSGRTIAELFQSGEECFRQWEHRCLAQVVGRKRCVIATGGGVVERADNRDLLNQVFTVFLDVSVPEAQRRTAKSNHRPLLKGGGDRLAALAERRLPWYRQVADVTVEVDDAPKHVNFSRLQQALTEAGVITGIDRGEDEDTGR